MGIAATQLETWSQKGKTGQFTDTYASIRANLLDGSSVPYPVKDTEIFLQGSYGNDTNVWADSDVDIVLKHNGAFYYDITGLTPDSQAQFLQTFGGSAAYGYPQFKIDAEGFLKRLYNGVVTGKKAVYIPGNGTRRDADVLLAAQFRRYYSYAAAAPDGFHEGVAFYVNGFRIENFPKQHSANCTAKHQATNGNFKSLIRIFKNMRNAMIRDGVLAEGVAPSYFIEGMLFNVPNESFVGTYADIWAKCLMRILTVDPTTLVCANQLQWLVRDGSTTSWSPANFNLFLNAAAKYWDS